MGKNGNTMNPIIDGPEKEKPVKKKRGKVKPEPISAIETPPKAPIGESNVYRTLAEWRERVKNSFS